MRQYWEQKREVPDAILMFRMGDFYEMFNDDAELGARVLGITLTSRDKGRTPLAGIPHHALESYLAKLVDSGYKVAISEQVEDARQAKGVVRREVVRVVTPGTLTDEELLPGSRSNHLVALAGEASVGVAVLELASGAFTVFDCPAASVIDELDRIEPAEILLPEPTRGGRHPLEAELRQRLSTAITYRTPSDFLPERAEQVLCEHYETTSLEGFGFREVGSALQAAGALVGYVRETQRGVAEHLRPPLRQDLADFMTLDQATLRSLEIERTLRSNARAGSLLAAVDRTCNPMGARLLRTWLCFPRRDVAEIRRRQGMIAAFRDDAHTRAGLRTLLREIGDIERMVGRVGVKRSTPRDLRALGAGLDRLRDVRELLTTMHAANAEGLIGDLDGLDDVANHLCSALAPDAPLGMREGNIFAAGYNAELDRLRSIGRDGQRWLAEFQARESQRTGIPSLKVAFNRVFGYYIEVTNPHRDRVPDDYVRKQTMKNAERFITEELKTFESEALSAESRANELEYDLFVALRDELTAHLSAIQAAADALARLDVLAGWADLALDRSYCCPEFNERGGLEIRGGRHPVLEQSLEAGFVPNDARLVAGKESFALITGPNMAGKSTYIRQVALLTLLAHCGCWVPAESMQFALVDRIFTRVGASDELARGQSTFMVEMLETANILHNATRHSLVILDEVGRGTSTFDGVALAWAISEHLATRVGCRTLFATHYHELTELGALLDPVFNLNVEVREYEEQIVFLHRIVAGAADRSYGVHVAKLAGVPAEVLDRANAVLNDLERTFARESQRPVLAAAQRRRLRQLRLFEEPEEIIVRQLRDVDVDALAAEDALDRLRGWRALLGGASPQTPPGAPAP